MDNNQANPVTPPTVSDPFFSAPSPTTSPVAPQPTPIATPPTPTSVSAPSFSPLPPVSPMAFPPPPVEAPVAPAAPPITPIQPITPAPLTPSFTPPPVPMPTFTPPVTPVVEPVATPVAIPAEEPVVVPPAPVVAPNVPKTTSSATPIDALREGKGSGKYQIRVIPDKCIGAASCIAVAPKAFRLDDQQIAEVLNTVGEETDENLLLAAQSCPTLAIEVIDTETGEKVWPK